MKASGIFPMPGDDEIDQHIIPINKTVPQDIFIHRRKLYGFKYAHNKSCIIYSSQEAFYPGDEEHLSTSVVGEIINIYLRENLLYSPKTESMFSQEVLLGREL